MLSHAFARTSLALTLTLFSASIAAADGPKPVETPDRTFEPLSADELRIAFETVLARFQSDAALPHTALRFPLVALAEPPKQRVIARKPNEVLPRQAELQVLHFPSNRTWLARVDLANQRILQLTAAPPGSQPGLSGEEYTAIDALVRGYEPWQRALRARGVDPAYAYIDTWAGGEPASDEAAARLAFGRQTRLVRCLTFARSAPGSATATNPYDRPIEGLVVMLDLNARKVVEMTDSGARPISMETGNAGTAQPLRPLHVEAPQGSEISVQGHLVRFRNWQFYAVLHPREGLVLYDVRFADHGQPRRIAYRLGLSEIYVPYGIADANWAWRSAFDVGEYNAGLSAQRLVKGVDVPDNAQLLDATFFSDLGPTADNPSGKLDAPESLALYERDAGLLWTRTDPSTRKRDSRRARELVATWNCWIGNYIYVFDWVFGLDGTIEVLVHLHGTTLNRGTTAEREASAPKIGKDARGTLVSAPHHQHFLSFRLDLDIDGASNQLMEMEAQPLAAAGYKNAFESVTRDIAREGFRDADAHSARHWHIESARVKNAFGKPTGYALEPEALAFPYSAPDFAGLLRARFAQHAFWFTRYHDDERYASGEFPNQSGSTSAGLAAFTNDEALQGQDIVLWYTLGFTHLARPEDYPVMPAESIGFKLQPRGFFRENPALELGE